MKKYEHTSTQLRELITNVFMQNKVPYDKHDRWLDLYRVAQVTTEIAGLRICKPADPETTSATMLCQPVFIDGFREPFFDSRDWLFKDVEKEIFFKHRPFILKEDLDLLYMLPHKLEFLPKVGQIFTRILQRGKNAGITWSLVSGPISSGGTGDREKNLELFHQEIIDETNKGYVVFNQMPFEDYFGQIHTKFPEAFTGKNNRRKVKNPIMRDVYIPMLRSGLIERQKMMKDWKTSGGASTEYRVAKELNIEVVEENSDVLETA